MSILFRRIQPAQRFLLSPRYMAHFLKIQCLLIVGTRSRHTLIQNCPIAIVPADIHAKIHFAIAELEIVGAQKR